METLIKIISLVTMVSLLSVPVIFTNNYNIEAKSKEFEVEYFTVEDEQFDEKISPQYLGEETEEEEEIETGTSYSNSASNLGSSNSNEDTDSDDDSNEGGDGEGDGDDGDGDIGDGEGDGDGRGDGSSITDGDGEDTTITKNSYEFHVVPLGESEPTVLTSEKGESKDVIVDPGDPFAPQQTEIKGKSYSTTTTQPFSTSTSDTTETTTQSLDTNTKLATKTTTLETNTQLPQSK